MFPKSPESPHSITKLTLNESADFNDVSDQQSFLNEYNVIDEKSYPNQ